MHRYEPKYGCHTYLFKRHSVVLQEEEAVFADGFLDLLNKALYYSWVIGVHQRQIDRLKFSEVVLLLCHGRRNPFCDMGLSRQVR